MKKTIPGFLLSFLVIFLLSNCEDNFDPQVGIEKTTVEFPSTQFVISESSEEQTFKLFFSNPAHIDGFISISIEKGNATRLQVNPEATNNRINLLVSKGDQEVTFKVKPKINHNVDGNDTTVFMLHSSSIQFQFGNKRELAVIVTDDDTDPIVNPINLPKGYSIGGPLGLTKTFIYNETGNIQRVVIQSGNSERADTYHYNSEGKIERINSYPQIDRVFTWSNNRISKSESVEFGVVKEFTEYDYDAFGNVSGTANYYRQPDGSFKLSFVIAYLYYTDNNLFKSLHYVPKSGTDEYELISTKTYSDYIDKSNPFPMVDILPTVKTMTQLPTSFHIEGYGMNLSYELKYEFNDSGLVTRRSSWDGQVSETTNYFYY